MLRLSGIAWDEDSEEHIWDRHKVTPREVEEAAFAAGIFARGRGRNVYSVYGRSEAGRYLFIVIRMIEDSMAKVITARDMTAVERRRYKRRMYH